MALSLPPGIRPIDAFQRFIFDLDGTIWRGHQVLPHAVDVLAQVRLTGGRVAFLTNNGSRSGREVAELLVELGIPAETREVVTSGRAARRVVAERGLSGCNAFIVGGTGLIEELEPLGLRLLSVEEGEHAEVVVVTRDEDFTYARLRAAGRAIARGALFVATNDDPTFPVEEGFWPGGGAMVAAVRAASGGVEPVVCGKPNEPMLREAEEAVGLVGEAILVGDRPRSDLASAIAMGWTGALVLTGVTEQADGIEPAPDLVLRDLGDLLVPV